MSLKRECEYCGGNGHSEADCTTRQLDEFAVRSARRRAGPTPSVWPHSTPERVRDLNPHDQTTPGRVTMTFTTLSRGAA